mmetsp:Transcript_6376/g.6593  ORF Transcript_6376/g.6593 Transcript_6376/m.6593 type:complete len:144 (-) Transcript_6376:43-474(-)
MGRLAGQIDGPDTRGETLLIMSGMVLDITRWLSEHPGGSSIIPRQALNVDCTVFFEIYHASRQSFLYLKEFYIGELAQEDLALVPCPKDDRCTRQDATGQQSNEEGGARHLKPSSAFIEQLRRVTPWRLRPEDLISFEVHKSF